MARLNLNQNRLYSMMKKQTESSTAELGSPRVMKERQEGTDGSKKNQ